MTSLISGSARATVSDSGIDGGALRGVQDADADGAVVGAAPGVVAQPERIGSATSSTPLVTAGRIE
ncbi:MAG TPA: hypothetical protein VFZ21_03230 [Gemmatimonadaceae bacterium]|nr:hypothetical protein [Gemmatimonadaceae bacterium]